MIIIKTPLRIFELLSLRLQGQNFTIEFAPNVLRNFYAKVLKTIWFKSFFFSSILMHYDASKMNDCWLFWQANLPIMALQHLLAS